MLADIEILILPYAGATGDTLVHRLVAEFNSSKWKEFRAAIAFGKTSGNYTELLDAMVGFMEGGGVVEMTFGADIFGLEVRGTEYDAVETWLTRFKDYPSAKIFLYHDNKPSRTFHPKVYLFANEETHTAMIILGSSNWSAGGFHDNVEANLIVHLDLKKNDNRKLYDDLNRYFVEYWQEAA